MGKLTTWQIADFINDGFIKIENAFPTELADQCRAILWKATKCDPQDHATWTEPVIRIGELALEPFKKAANTVVLHSAFDQLTGEGNWLSRESLGSFVIRFPSKKPATDTGWHVDASFPGEIANNYLDWRINLYSKGRVLLMLFLFSDVSEKDAPTIIRKGSHLDVTKVLEPAGEKGIPFMALAEKLDSLPFREESLATGKAGTVYLCHPFIVHAGQDHHGTAPKFMAQPPLLSNKNFRLDRMGNELSPVEKAIVHGLGK